MIIENYEIDRQDRKEEIRGTFDEYGIPTKDTEETAFEQILQIVDCITTCCNFTVAVYEICKEELCDLSTYLLPSIREEVE